MKRNKAKQKLRSDADAAAEREASEYSRATLARLTDAVARVRPPATPRP